MNEVFEKIKKKTQKVRYKIAWVVASDLIDDLEYRLGSFLCNQTGGLLSKAYYPLEYMKGAAAEHFDKLIDDSVRDFARELKESATYHLNDLDEEGDPTKWIDPVRVDKLLIEWGVGVENVEAKPHFCNEWECKNNKNGQCYVTDDECPNIQEFFENRRKGLVGEE